MPVYKEVPVTTSRHSRAIAGSLCALLLGALLVACGSSTTDPGANTTRSPDASASATPCDTSWPTCPSPTASLAPAGACQPRVTAPAPIPSSPAPKPIAPQGAASYTNTTAGYSIKYPSNWYVSDATPTGGFQILNYTPPNTGTEISPPPYNAVRIDFFENPTHLTPEAYHTANPPYSFREIGVRACWGTLSRAPVGGHTAYALVVWSADYTDGGKTKIYRPGIRHYITAGAYLLRADELYSEGSQPSAALRQVIASMTFTA
jgi:hypothetical protein